MGSTRRGTYRWDPWPPPSAPQTKSSDGDGDSGELPGTLATLAAGLVGITIGIMALMIATVVLFLVN